MEGGGRQIQLTQGKVALVDAADFEWLSQWKWHLANARSLRPYAVRNVPRREGGGSVLMHRAILMPKPGLVVDHISGATLDNRRVNLREATYAQNRVNSNAGTGACAYFGVYWCNTFQTYIASCSKDGRKVWARRARTAEDAARAYDAKARELWGEFARLNFPEAA